MGSVFKGVGNALGSVLGGASAPAVAQAAAATDPEAERRKSENEAAAAANAKTAELSRQRKQSSLLSVAGQASTGQAQTTSALAYGKGKLGE